MSFVLKWLAGSFGSYILIAVAVLVLGLLSALGVQTWRLHSLQTDMAEAQSAFDRERLQLAQAGAAAEAHARSAELRSANAEAAADALYHQEMDRAKHTEKTLADLRAGTLRLRHDPAAACPGGVPQPGAGAGGAADPADQWRADAAAAIGIADESDALIRALQSTVKDAQRTCAGGP